MSLPWGAPASYLTDDRDARPEDLRELVITVGGNGDYYVGVRRPEHRFYESVRISTSGGAAAENPALVAAVAAAYRAMLATVK